MTKKLNTADKALKKALEKEQKTRQKRDELASQLQEKRESREALIHQVANEEASEEALEQNRQEIAKLQDRFQVQEKALERVNQEVEQAKREAFQAEREAKAAEAASYRQRYNELWQQLESLLSELKLCQIKTGTGGGGVDLAQRLYLRILGIQPAAAESDSPASEHLTGEDRYRISSELAQEEAERNMIPPGEPENLHEADPARTV